MTGEFTAHLGVDQLFYKNFTTLWSLFY